MSARAVWKGVIGFGEERVPVKLYTAVSDRNVHFRLLDRRRQRPVHQAMIEPQSGKTVSLDDRHKAVIDKQDRILFDTEELDELAPAPSRDIEVMHFLPAGAIDNQWYQRPYFLGPDGDDDTFDAFAAALASSGREGLVHWVMRHKAYVGALRDYDGHPVLITLRHLDEVVDADALEPPGGDKLNAGEVKMATDLVEMYAADFEPETYQDEYRQRLEALVEAKRSGKRVKVKRRRRQDPSDDIASSLKASLAQERKRA
ncbi:Ku protein [Salinicola sp. MH3R3-1]|uniref:non-homologous end joining protein Ku n=1 Tax=Salinicola sp. MH3R3-1 TaxID=1928762 RepID=UPI00094EEB76|nr:Ku protein [Salinicola sp. MH3R3-1]OLO07007.1 Ku protein [Salinicola sp. MH3R3-1]